MTAYFFSSSTKLLVKADDNTIVTEHSFAQNNLVNQYLSTAVIKVAATQEQSISIAGLSKLKAILITSNKLFDVAVSVSGTPVYTGINSTMYSRLFDLVNGASVSTIYIKAFTDDVVAKVTLIGDPTT